MDRKPSNLCEEYLAYALRTVTEAAARRAYSFIGRGDAAACDRAAARAMHEALCALPVSGTVVVGCGDQGACESLFHGQAVGDPDAADQFDIAIDPVEGISYLAKGMTNAMAVIAMAPRGAMFDPGPAFYMEKLVVPPAASGRVDPTAPVERRLADLAAALGKDVRDLTVFVLEKPRHRALVARIHDAGARVALYPAGDVAGALMAAIPDSGIDALMGTGGTSEGLISAGAVHALGGAFFGRIDPQLPTERVAVSRAGLDTARWLRADELVRSETVYFCATGITTGLLFEGVARTAGGGESTQSLMVAGPRAGRQVLTTFHPPGAED